MSVASIAFRPSRSRVWTNKFPSRPARRSPPRSPAMSNRNPVRAAGLSWALASHRRHQRAIRAGLRGSFAAGLLLVVRRFLVVIHLYNVAHHRARRLAAVFHSVLHDRGYHNLRIAPRREAYEPAVHLLRTQAIRSVVAHQLRRARLSTQ